jgi:formylglycine-generating enzyme
MRLAAVSLLTLLACQEPAPARDQWRVTIATDAPLPQFGDRLLVELLAEGGELACGSCRRLIGVAAGDFPLSFGIASLDPARRHLVRARLYRADHTGGDGLPHGEVVIDALGRLPAAQGITPVSIVAGMDCFGVTARPSESLACRDGALAPIEELSADPPLPAPGSWPPAQPTPCGAIPDDMVCIKGGAFLLGSPHHLGLEADLATEPERLVVLSAFAIDRDEVTVGRVRELVLRGTLSEAPILPDPDPKAPGATCLYLGAGNDGNDAMPVNCVSHELAAAVCAALGRRLPTEAEWELAAGQRDGETPFPWGYDDDVCAHAIVGMGRYAEAYEPETITCRVQEDGSFGPWGPQAGGHPADVTREGVKNMGGNLAEWVMDAFSPYSSSCLGEKTPTIDPRCEGGPPWVYRGSGWLAFPAEARAFIRHRASFPSTNLGFRCAMSFSASR